MTESGSIEIDRLQDRLDLLEKAAREAAIKDAIIQGLKAQLAFWVKLFAASIPVIGTGVALLTHYLKL